MPRKRVKNKQSQQNKNKNEKINNLTAKERAVEYFGAGDYANAVAQFTLCLAERRAQDDQKQQHDDVINEELAPLYSNRSMCYLRNGDVSNALKDAELTIKHNPTWPKGYLRKGAALAYALQLTQALQVYNIGLTACSVQDTALMTARDQLARQLSSLEQARADTAARLTQRPGNTTGTTGTTTHEAHPPQPSQSSSQNQNTSFPAKIQDRAKLVIWLREGGARFPKVDIQPNSEEIQGVPLSLNFSKNTS